MYRRPDNLKTNPMVTLARKKIIEKDNVTNLRVNNIIIYAPQTL